MQLEGQTPRLWLAGVVAKLTAIFGKQEEDATKQKRGDLISVKASVLKSQESATSLVKITRTQL